jgi:putative membrane protein
MMKKILALAALAGPLAFAPLAFGADDPDATFYKKAAEGGLFEVDTGNQAAKSSNNQQIKDFGSMLVTDHTAANDKLKALAASKNISLPTSATMGQMAQKAKLDVLTGDTYDKSFIKTQIKAHQQTIALFKKEIGTGQDADAKAFATATLPTLKKHLKQAQSLAGSTGATS